MELKLCFFGVSDSQRMGGRFWPAVAWEEGGEHLPLVPSYAVIDTLFSQTFW